MSLIEIMLWIGGSALASLAFVKIVGAVSKIKNEYKMFKNANGRRSDAYYYRDRIVTYWGKEEHIKDKEYYTFNELPTLPTQQFAQFFSVDPSKWELTKGCAYRTDDHSSAIFFRPFSNYLAYERFRKTYNKEQTKIAADKKQHMNSLNQNEKLEKVLALVQNDIDAAFEKSAKLREEAFEMTIAATENLTKEYR